MLANYLTVKEDGHYEMEVKKSRFICYLYRIEDEDDAKEKIQAIKKEHWKASHNCTAFVLGDQNDIQRSSDDGEPAGTAGIPMLEILKKRQVINTLAIVTRYFGGTELGRGGLIRTYGGVVADALTAIGIVEGKLQQEINVTMDYANHGKLENFIENSSYDLKETVFTDVVTVTCMIDEDKVELFKEDIANLLSGQGKVTLGEKAYFEREVN